MAHHLLIDTAAWTSRWRTRATGEKTFLALGLLLVGVSAPGPLVSLLVLAVSGAVATVLARVPVTTYARALAAPAAFILVGLVGVVVTLDGAGGAGGMSEPVWTLGPLAVTTESLALGGEVGARSLACAAAVMLLATTTPVTDLLETARVLRVPAVVVDVAAVVYRMIFALIEAQASIREAQTARLGYGSRGAAVRSLGALAGATFVRAWTRARDLEQGLAGRGSGSLRGLSQARPVSWAFVAASVALLLALAGLSVASAVPGSLGGSPW